MRALEFIDKVKELMQRLGPNLSVGFHVQVSLVKLHS